MKKVLALAMALVMMLAVCVPAFAADTIINQDSDPKNGDVAVKTTFAETDVKWSVKFPSEIDITWNDTNPYNCGMDVATQLKAGDKITVTVAPKDGSTTMTSADTTDTLNFTLANDTAKEFGAAVGTFNADGTVNTYVAATDVPTVQVDTFAGKTIASYEGYVTYSVAYVPAP